MNRFSVALVFMACSCCIGFAQPSDLDARKSAAKELLKKEQLNVVLEAVSPVTSQPYVLNMTAYLTKNEFRGKRPAKSWLTGRVRRRSLVSA